MSSDKERHEQYILRDHEEEREAGQGHGWQRKKKTKSNASGTWERRAEALIAICISVYAIPARLCYKSPSWPPLKVPPARSHPTSRAARSAGEIHSRGLFGRAACHPFFQGFSVEFQRASQVCARLISRSTSLESLSPKTDSISKRRFRPRPNVISAIEDDLSRSMAVVHVPAENATTISGYLNSEYGTLIWRRRSAI